MSAAETDLISLAARAGECSPLEMGVALPAASGCTVVGYPFAPVLPPRPCGWRERQPAGLQVCGWEYLTRSERFMQ